MRERGEILDGNTRLNFWQALPPAQFGNPPLQCFGFAPLSPGQGVGSLLLKSNVFFGPPREPGELSLQGRSILLQIAKSDQISVKQTVIGFQLQCLLGHCFGFRDSVKP